MTKLTPAQQNVITALKEGNSIRRNWLSGTFRYADTGKPVIEATANALSRAGIIQFKREGDYFYLVLKDTMPEPAAPNMVELEIAPQPHESVAIAGVATVEPVAPRPVNMSVADYETRPGLHSAAKKGIITVKTLTGMSITRARQVKGAYEVRERGGCWHLYAANDTLIVGV